MWGSSGFPVNHWCVCLCVFPQALMTVGRIEMLFMSQRQWERGDVGIHCSDEKERKRFSEKQQFILQFFLGFLKINPFSCEHQRFLNQWEYLITLLNVWL